MTHTLVIVRHAKSDWAVPAADHDRPLAKRGRRQAPETGRWLAAHGIHLDRAVVSTARRARQTWELVAAELGDAAPPVRVSEAAYTFDGEELLGVVRKLPELLTHVALVGHNPAIEELVELLTGRWVAMPTSALAIIELDDWATADRGSGRLVKAGRPADGHLD